MIEEKYLIHEQLKIEKSEIIQENLHRSLPLTAVSLTVEFFFSTKYSENC